MSVQYKMSVLPVKPSERYQLFSESGNRLTKIIGFDVLAPKLLYSFKSYVTIGSLILFCTFTLCTLVLAGMEDWRNIVQQCVMVGIGPIGVGKLYTALFHSTDLRRVEFLCRDIYRKFETKSEKYWKSLDESVDRVARILKLVRLGYFVSIMNLIMMPFVLLLWNGSRILMLQYQIPGLDVETNTGFFLTNGQQSISMIITGCGFYAADLFIILFLTQTFLFADIFKLKVNDIQETITEQKSAQDSSKNALKLAEQKITQMLVDLIQWHQLYIKYTDFVNALCYPIIASQVLSSAFSVATTLFAVVALERHAFYFVNLVLMTYSMVVYCLLGTKIEYANDDICYEAYNIAWPDMNCEQRKMVRLMLLESQNPKSIKILGFIPLSVGTVLEIFRLIYSMVMLMMQFF